MQGNPISRRRLLHVAAGSGADLLVSSQLAGQVSAAAAFAAPTADPVLLRRWFGTIPPMAPLCVKPPATERCR